VALSLPNPDTILDGRTFQTFSGGMAAGYITVHATAEDVSWILPNLGQYVDGRRGSVMFRAYVETVEKHGDGSCRITVLVEPL
jgi:hypothetical protein